MASQFPVNFRTLLPLSALALTGFLSSCEGFNPFGPKEETLSSGLSYRLVRDEAETKAQAGDFITFDILVLGDNRDTIFNSAKTGQPVQIQLQASKEAADLMDGFQQLGAGDSAVFRLAADSIPNKPANLSNTKEVFYYVNMREVKPKEVLDAERDAQMKMRMDGMREQAMAEAPAIEKWLADKNLTAQKTPNGLYYIIESVGSADKPRNGDQVLVNYKGMLLDGKVFDSSEGRDPFQFPIGAGQVIPGWDEGIPLFSKGGKGKLIIPSALAYGPQSPSPDIPANSVLVFDIELVDIVR